ncbi:MAG: hypothetical protein M3256_05540 [Actinomycetota bacterium]|nr:hypothetical protein [Actinomycetota bacterium]
MAWGLSGEASSGTTASRRAIAAALAAVGILGGALSIRSLSPRPGTTKAAAVTAASSTSEAVDRNAPISVRLVLEQNVVDAGSTIHGVVEIANPTGQAVTVRVCDFDTWPTVVLSSSVLGYELPMSAAVCNGSATLPPGTTRRAVTVSTTYPSCTYPDHGFPASLARPFCVGTTDPPSQLPPLPPGRYTTTIVMPTITHQVDVPAPSEVTIR